MSNNPSEVSILTKELERLTADHLCDIEIDTPFLIYREDLVSKLKPDGRSPSKMSKDSDATIIEYTLLNKGLVETPSDLGHDIILNKTKIDVKVIQTFENFSVKSSKAKWYRRSLRDKEVDYFAFFSYENKHSAPFIEGDITTMRFFKLVEAKRLLDNLKISNFGGFYYPFKESS